MRKTEAYIMNEEAYNRCFPSRLRELLKRKGETQKKLATFINVNQQTVSLWKDGKTAPDINALKKIAEYYNVSADYLIGITKTPIKLDVLLNKNTEELENRLDKIAKLYTEMGPFVLGGEWRR